MTTQKKTSARFEARATEASELIKALIEKGTTLEQIADSTQSSVRSVYRWWREGQAPHPLLLEGLRKLAASRK